MPLKILSSQNWDISIYYCNPNIQPIAEHTKRLDALAKYVQSHGYQVYIDGYRSELWEQRVGALYGPYPIIKGSADFLQNSELRKQRCAACYELRFEILSQTAAENGFDAISTTLSISPYQDIKLMSKIMAKYAKEYYLESAFEDFTNQYQEATRISKELGMYRQNYCGCRYSKIEAQAEREARKASKKTVTRH